MRLTATDPNALEIEPSNWIMLKGSGTTTVPVFRWYQVLFCDDAPEVDPNVAGGWQLYATLDGANWPKWKPLLLNIPRRSCAFHLPLWR